MRLTSLAKELNETVTHIEEITEQLRTQGGTWATARVKELNTASDQLEDVRIQVEDIAAVSSE